MPRRPGSTWFSFSFVAASIIWMQSPHRVFYFARKPV